MVYVHLADGFEEIEALTVVDLLRRAQIPVETVSIMGRLNLMGAHGIEVVADVLFDDADYHGCEMIVLPGGSQGAINLSVHDELTEKLYSFANMGKWIAAICAAPAFVLGRHGILEGRKATCYPGLEVDLQGAEYVPERIVIDENIITSKGPSTAMDFALTIIETLKGEEARAQISKDLLLT
jgi:4-methyl-5(b-hydroxyethyl)-thiazole monophosphate biosynthesis